MDKAPELRLDWTAWHDLDRIAHQYTQDPSIANRDEWFNVFRSSLWAFEARANGVRLHYRRLHEWLGERRQPILVDEYDVTALLFGMASSLECATYALNVLGFAMRGDAFRDYRDPGMSKYISHGDVTYEPKKSEKGPNVFRTGYAAAFPKFQECWIARLTLIEAIFDQHNASKHRYEGFSGNGFKNTDDPPGYFEKLQILADSPEAMDYRPWQKISLSHIQGIDQYEYETIEQLSQAYAGLVLQSGEAALDDAIHVLPLRRLIV